MILTANSTVIENILNKQRKLQIKFLTLGREREKRKRKREEEERQNEENKSYEREQRELEKKITAIKRKIEERKRRKFSVQKNGYRKRQWEDNRRKQFEKRQRVKKKSNRFFDDSDLEQDISRKTKKLSNNKFQPALEILDDLMKSHLATPFCKPVDAVKYNIPDYNIKIKKPMDLGTIRTNIKRNQYKELWEVWADIRLVWDNCRTYNGPLNPFTIKANALAQIFDARLEEFESPNRGKAVKKVKRSKSSSELTIPKPKENKNKESSSNLKSVTPVDIKALRKEINNSSVAQLQNVINILERRGKAVKDKDGNYELDFETLDDETAREIHTFFKEQDTKIESQKLKKLTLEQELDLMESEEMEKLTVGNTGKRSLPHTTSQNRTHQILESTKAFESNAKKWPSKVGVLTGKVQLFEGGIEDVCTYSSSSSSDEDEDLFKMQEKTIPPEQSDTKKPAVQTSPKKAIDTALWSTTETDTSAAAATRVVQKYSKHIDNTQSNATAEESQNSEIIKKVNVNDMTNSEEPSASKCENGEFSSDPINHFEQADLLDDLFS